MAFTLPNSSTFEIAASYGSAVDITAISNASPPVVTAAGHDLEDGDVVVLEVGMARLTNRAFRVIDVDEDTFALEGIDTTNVQRYPVSAGVGTARQVLTWVQIPQITEVTTSGGDQQFYTFGFLEDDDDRQLPTSKSPATMTLTVADDPAQPFVPVVEAADEDKQPRVQRLNLPNGSVILYNSNTSITSTPALSRNNLMTRQISLALQGRIARYSAE